jgi:hypothetical protein
MGRCLAIKASPNLSIPDHQVKFIGIMQKLLTLLAAAGLSLI